jgi:hypothetical protein
MSGRDEENDLIAQQTAKIDAAADAEQAAADEAVALRFLQAPMGTLPTKELEEAMRRACKRAFTRDGFQF